MIKGYKDKEILAKKYKELGSMQKVADYFGVSKKLILNHMKRFDIPRNPRPSKQEKPKKIDTFHKGYTITWNGYKMVKCPNHPHCDGKGYIREHILVMEKYLGRYLTEDEVVHHIDENKANNVFTNLIWCTYQQNRIFSVPASSGKNVKKKYKVLQLDLEGNLVAEWNTFIEAARSLGVNDCSTISKCAHHLVHRNSCYGYKWDLVYCESNDDQSLIDLVQKAYKFAPDETIVSLIKIIEKYEH